MCETTFTEVNGAAIRYALSGNGPQTLVLFHELGGSLESWKGLVPLLPENLTVLRADMRGAGMSEKCPARSILALSVTTWLRFSMRSASPAKLSSQGLPLVARSQYISPFAAQTAPPNSS